MSENGIITLIVACVGAIPGIIALVWNIIRSRPKLKLDAYCSIANDEDKNSFLGIEYIVLRVTNHREMPVKIQYYGFKLKNGNYVRDRMEYKPYKPDSISGGDNEEITWNADELRELIAPREAYKIIGLFVEDGVGNFYKTKLRYS